MRNPFQTECLTELLDLLMRMPGLCIRQTDFNPSATVTLFGILRKLVALVGSHYPDGSDARSNLIVFPAAVVKMDNKSEFERVPVALLTAAVDLVAEMARVDPDGEWCRWQGKVREG